MRNALVAAMLLIALNVSAGTIHSIDPASVQMRSGEHFITVRGSGLGTQFLWEGPNGRYLRDANYDDGVGGTAIGWLPEEVANTPGLYTLTILGGGLREDSGPVNFSVYKPGRPLLTLHLPELIAFPVKSRLGAPIRYEVSVVGGESPTVKCDHESGATLPYGQHVIRCFASDLSGQEAAGEISVNLWDGAAPYLTLPKALEVPADNEEGAYVKYEAWAVDEIDGEMAANCAPKAGSFFRPGRTAVQCEAWDASLNGATGSFDVMVMPRDIGYLELRVPEKIVVTADEDGFAVIDYGVVAYGSADPDPVVECDPPSGSTFTPGEWKVYCIATDDFGQRAEGGFPVYVEEYRGLKLADVSAEATSESGASVSFEGVEGWTETLSCSHESGSAFAIGTTSVRCESRTEAGVLSAGKFNVTVADTIAPHIAAVRTKSGAIDAEKNVAVQVEVDATDAVDAMPRCSVSGIEGVTGLVTSDLAVSLRNEEASDREFRLQVTCVDSAGNRTSEAIPVRLGAETDRRRPASN